MLKLQSFTFNVFSENTYVLYSESGDSIIIDPGCSNRFEEAELVKFIEDKKLKPVLLLNTHCHIDHILGNRFVVDKYSVPFRTSIFELQNLRAADVYADQFGVASPKSPEPEAYLKERDTIKLGSSILKVFFTPGHSPGHLSFYCSEQNFILSGDVLFRESIGRTDLPGGDYKTLIKSIKEKLFVLEDDVEVYSGHGPKTTIGYERKHNPFLLREV
jgi:hydroxyacylglutathione hydrolase